MRIDRLGVTRLRNLTQVTLEPAPGLNLVIGPNGAGKTALLEAIYLLARARSFRTPRIDEVIQHGSPRVTVRAEVRYDGGEQSVVGLERGEGRLVLRRDGENVGTVSHHARCFPVVVLTPDSQQLVFGAPATRRDWLDWAMFHVEPEYLDHWRAYHRALRQRNRLLRDQAPPGRYTPWEVAMDNHGAAITEARDRFVNELGGAGAALAARIGVEMPEVSLDPGWKTGISLGEALETLRGTDIARGHTSAGPHRADLLLRRNGIDVGTVLSRGESKRLVLILLLAEAQVRAARQGEKPLLLLDDFGAELDALAQALVMSLLSEAQAQAFLTSTQVPAGTAKDHSALFHVERGSFTKMIE